VYAFGHLSYENDRTLQANILLSIVCNDYYVVHFINTSHIWDKLLTKLYRLPYFLWC